MSSIFRKKLDFEIMSNALHIVGQRHLDMTHQTWECKIRTSYNLTDNILNLRELWPLKFEIEKAIYEYMFENKKFFNGYIYNSWVNVYDKGFFQEFHNHKEDCIKFICGVVYLTSDMSDIEFHIDNRIRITPEFCDILLFEDHDNHRVLPYEGENKRISLAFNYRKVDKWKGLLP